MRLVQTDPPLQYTEALLRVRASTVVLLALCGSDSMHGQQHPPARYSAMRREASLFKHILMLGQRQAVYVLALLDGPLLCLEALSEHAG